jgi:uncharacterized protein with PIN domain
MDIQLVLTIVAAALLAAVIVMQIIGRKKSDIGEIAALLRRTADEQREAVSRQIANGATEQFQRFGLIQESVQTFSRRGNMI